MSDLILTINGASSTIKFAAFTSTRAPQRILTGQVEGIGRADTELAATDTPRAESHRVAIRAADHGQAADSLIDWIAGWAGNEQSQAIGHRVVHGGVRLDRHQVVTADLIRELRRTQPLDLAHLPRQIALIEAFGERLPGIIQIACFDTAFHRQLPRIAQILPIPRRYFEAGIRRLGFHGLSYAYLLDESHAAGMTKRRGKPSTWSATKRRSGSERTRQRSAALTLSFFPAASESTRRKRAPVSAKGLSVWTFNSILLPTTGLSELPASFPDSVPASPCM